MVGIRLGFGTLVNSFGLKLFIFFLELLNYLYFFSQLIDEFSHSFVQPAALAFVVFLQSLDFGFKLVNLPLSLL
jgi:hypothetical protein